MKSLARATLVAFACAMVATAAGAQSQGPSGPGTVVNNGGIGVVPWLMPSQALTSDDVYAFSGVGTGSPSQYLVATNFSFTLPPSAVVVGIEVGVEKKVATGTATDNAVRIVKGGSIGSTDRSDVNPWPTTDTVVLYGGATDLWGETWTAADINNANFGVAISGKDSISGALLQVDTFEITVFYAVCGDSIVNSPTEDCDIGDTNNGDCCSSTCQFEANGSPCADDGNRCNFEETCNGTGSCVSATTPLTTCLTAQKGLLLYKDKTPNSKDKLVWKWIKGQATTLGDLGNPAGTTAYTLCLYAGTATAEATVPPDATKWKPIGTKGFKYKDKPGTADGITKVILKSGAANKSKALVKGKGENLPDLTTPFDTPVTAQLVNSSNHVCMTNTFTTAKKNETGFYKAKAP